MSNLYEALTRGSDSSHDTGIDSLWDGAATVRQSGTAAASATAAEIQPPPVDPTPEAPLANDDMAWHSIRAAHLDVRPSAPILPFDGSHWHAGEEYRILRTRIVQHPKKLQVIVVTSVGPGDGKTVTVINLAGALALKSGGKVLLLDGDFRRSGVCAELGLGSTPGLAGVLKGDCSLADAIIQAEQIPNLYVLPAGESKVNPAELLDSPRWTALCASCRVHFSHVSVDSPPVGAVADYDLLQAAGDAIILVARPDHTDRKLCFSVLQSVPREKLIGLVVNGIKGHLLEKSKRKYAAAYYGLPKRS